MAYFRVNSPPVVLETVDEETIIVNLETGSYYDLGHVGSHVLRVLEAGGEVDAVVGSVARRYSAGTERVDGPVRSLIDELVAEGILIEASPNGGDPASEPEPSARAYEDPKLGKYTDMQELLLLDPVHEVNETGWPNKA